MHELKILRPDQWEAGGIITPQLEQEPACLACRDTGIVVSGACAEPCRCRVDTTKRDRLAAAVDSIPPSYRHCKRSDWRNDWWPWPDAFNGWAEVAKAPKAADTPWCLIALGKGTGAGKTHALTSVYREMAQELPNPARAIWIDVPTALRFMFEEWEERDRCKAAREPYQGGDTRRDLHEAPLVLLDEWGCERADKGGKANGFVTHWLVSIVLYRFTWRLPTLISTNFEDIMQFDRYEPRLTSRLGEGGHWHVFAGKDRRIHTPGGK